MPVYNGGAGTVTLQSSKPQPTGAFASLAGPPWWSFLEERADPLADIA